MQTPSPLTGRIVRTLAFAAIVFGIALRFFRLDAPLFWQDEQYTSLYATGHYDRDVRAMFDGKVRTRDEVARFGRIEPGSSAADVVAALREEDPQHPPAFYLLEHATLEAAGSSIADMRLLPAILGVLGLGLAFLLGRRLFGSPDAGLVTSALFALSPIFVIYSRQAREYGLFVDDVLLASLALLAALATPPRHAPWKWLIYAATVALGFYTHPLFTLAVASHAVTVLLERVARVRKAASFAVAVLVAGAAYLPWVSHTVHENLDWAAVPYPLKYVVEKTGFNAAALSFDGEFRYASLTPLAAACALAAFAAIAVFARGGGAARRFVLPLALTAALAMAARDVLVRSHVSTIARYLTPSLVGFELAIAGAVAACLAARSPRVRAAGLAAFVAALALGAASGVVRGASANWWDNNDQAPFQAIGAVASGSPHPLLYVSTYYWIPREVALYVPRDARFVMFSPDGPVPAVPALPASEPAYLVAPSVAVLARYEVMARGRYVVTNVSPQVDTLIRSFHREIARDQRSIASRSVFADIRPDESLFYFQPLQARRAPKAAARR